MEEIYYAVSSNAFLLLLTYSAELHAVFTRFIDENTVCLSLELSRVAKQAKRLFWAIMLESGKEASEINIWVLISLYLIAQKHKTIHNVLILVCS